jgi:hypothetical protein
MSGLPRGTKPKKMAAKPVAKSKKVKKMSENQKIEALEQDVVDYVGKLPRSSLRQYSLTHWHIHTARLLRRG